MKLLAVHKESFTKNFDENKKVVQGMLTDPTKKLRNVIAGYATRLVKNEKEL